MMAMVLMMAMVVMAMMAVVCGGMVMVVVW